jgi:hypothetical protein
MVIVELPAPPEIDVGLKLTVTPLGAPEAASEIAELNPPVLVVVIVDVPELPVATLTAVGEADTVKVRRGLLGAPEAANAIAELNPAGKPKPPCHVCARATCHSERIKTIARTSATLARVLTEFETYHREHILGGYTFFKDSQAAISHLTATPRFTRNRKEDFSLITGCERYRLARGLSIIQMGENPIILRP